MIKKNVKYVDYKGNEREENFYFNLNQPEVLEMELSTEGGLSDYLDKIIKAQNKGELIKWFKIILLRSYGEKSDDGRRFIKSPELSEGFSQTEAFVKIYMELVNDAEKASDFIKGIVPSFDNIPDVEPASDNVKTGITVTK